MSDFANLYASTMRFLADSADELVANRVTPEIKAINLDDKVLIKDLPAKDLLMLSDFHLDVDEHFFNVYFMVGVTTFEDVNLFRHRSILDYVFNKLLPTRRIMILDADDGTELGNMIVQNGTAVSPVIQSETRTAQFIVVSALSDQTANLRMLV